MKIDLTKEEKAEYIRGLIEATQRSINEVKFHLIKLRADLTILERRKFRYEKKLEKYLK